MQQREIEASLQTISNLIPQEAEIAKVVKSHRHQVKPVQKQVIALIQCLDLTSLKSLDTRKTINALISKAQVEVNKQHIHVASLCVYQPFVAHCANMLGHAGVGVAAVAGGFPHGQMNLEMKCEDIKTSVKLGATEIDVVINRGQVLDENWAELFHEVCLSKSACGPAKLKVIMATGELPSFTHMAKTSWVCMLAGADFLKTSTGMEPVNATLEAGVVMMRMIRAFENQFGKRIGIKPAGGIRTTEQALAWWALLHNELGEDWSKPSLFRIGASSLLDDLVANLK